MLYSISLLIFFMLSIYKCAPLLRYSLMALMLHHNSLSLIGSYSLKCFTFVEEAFLFSCISLFLLRIWRKQKDLVLGIRWEAFRNGCLLLELIRFKNLCWVNWGYLIYFFISKVILLNFYLLLTLKSANNGFLGYCGIIYQFKINSFKAP